MTGIIATIEIGPRSMEIYNLMEQCSDEIEGCEFCNMRQECDDYCDTHLYSYAELTPDEFQKHLTVVMRMWKTRKKLRYPAAAECSIEFPKFQHRESSLVCY